ncbi:FUSC family protein [Streptomyces sp. NPDC058231]|uniref:FUSC family protein n=1 Tax=Streptomyces sp. NPDC058231 TaxID=3346392 RepID=UPI0036EEEA6D
MVRWHSVHERVQRQGAGAWCYERRLPATAVPVLRGGRGLARATTRQAVQATAAGAFALGVGQLLSADRWYWAVGTVWWVFVNTASRGETLVRGFRRILGTVARASPSGCWSPCRCTVARPSPRPLVAVCVFGIFYTAAVSYSWMVFFVTVMAGLLYGLLGVLNPQLLVLRLTETGTGAFGAALAVVLVLPVTLHATTDAWIQRALRCVHTCTAEATARLAGSPDADPGPRVAELEALLGRVRLSLAPLVHPLNPLRARKARARQVLGLLDLCAREVRGLATVAADPDASHDARLRAACRRVEFAVLALAQQAPGGTEPLAAPAHTPDHHPGAEAALAHVHALERALAELAAPLRTSPRAPLVTA